MDVIDPGLADEQPTLTDGDFVVRCEVCGSNIFKHPEELVFDEDVQLYNTDEECIYCHQEGGFKKIGIFKACENCDDLSSTEPAEDMPEDSIDPEAEDDTVEESVKSHLTEAKWTRDQILAGAKRLAARASKSTRRPLDDEEDMQEGIEKPLTEAK